ncbi:hypothetical protein [Porticoccus sp.]
MWKYVLKGGIQGTTSRVMSLIVAAFLLFWGITPELIANYFQSPPEWVTSIQTRVVVICTTVLLGAWIIYIFREVPSRIFLNLQKWAYQHKHGITWEEDPLSIHSFSYVISSQHNLALVGGIRLRGCNTTKSPLLCKEVYLRSLVTGERIEGKINGLGLTDNDVEILGRRSFYLTVSFPNEDGHLTNNSILGISFETFLSRFSNFEIVMETNRSTVRHQFYSEVTKGWVDSIRNGLLTRQPAEMASALIVK